MCIYICVYIYVYICMCVYIYIYIIYDLVNEGVQRVGGRAVSAVWTPPIGILCRGKPGESNLDLRVSNPLTVARLKPPGTNSL